MRVTLTYRRLIAARLEAHIDWRLKPERLSWRKENEEEIYIYMFERFGEVFTPALTECPVRTFRTTCAIFGIERGSIRFKLTQTCYRALKEGGLFIGFTSCRRFVEKLPPTLVLLLARRLTPDPLVFMAESKEAIR